MIEDQVELVDGEYYWVEDKHFQYVACFHRDRFWLDDCCYQVDEFTVIQHIPRPSTDKRKG